MVSTGCTKDQRQQIEAGLRGSRVLDPIPLPAIAIDLVCDVSRGSPCSEGTVSSSLDETLPIIAARPGSEIRVFVMGAAVDQTILLETARSPSPSGKSDKAVQVIRERFASDTRRLFLRALSPFFHAPRPRRSPIAESIMKVALDRPESGGERIVIVVTDALEYSDVARFECRLLPRSAAFIRSLQVRQLFTQHSLADVTVQFVNVGIQPIDRGRCPATIARFLAIESLWQAACRAAGAKEFSITAHGPTIAPKPQEGGPS